MKKRTTNTHWPIPYNKSNQILLSFHNSNKFASWGNTLSPKTKLYKTPPQSKLPSSVFFLEKYK